MSMDSSALANPPLTRPPLTMSCPFPLPATLPV
jgi:hypothetical protein